MIFLAATILTVLATSSLSVDMETLRKKAEAGDAKARFNLKVLSRLESFAQPLEGKVPLPPRSARCAWKFCAGAVGRKCNGAVPGGELRSASR